MAVVAFSQRREAQDGGIIQRSTGCCRGQSSGKGQWCSSTPEPAKAGAAQIRCRCVPPHARMPRCSYPWSCAHCRCSILMVLDRNTLSGRRVHTSLSVRPERDLSGLALDSQRHERAAERASAGGISLHVAIHVEWRAACPAAYARPATAHRCGSSLHGRSSGVAGRGTCIWDRWARADNVEYARATDSYRTDSKWIMCG